jgi:NADP-dependent 3-hydroxy acid dehydrogenase YdfG
LVDLNKDELKKALEEFNSEHIKYYFVDVLKAIDVEYYVDETVKIYEKIDVFFNNAGIEGVVKSITD